MKFNIASEASQAYILIGQKLIESGANEDLAKRDPSTFTEAKRM